MIAILIALGVLIVILIVTMWRGRDLGQPLAQRVRTVILGVLIATAVAAAILYPIVLPIVLIPPAVLALMASPIVVPYAIYVHRRQKQGLAHAWMAIAEMNFVPAPPKVTVMAQPLKANPYVELYSNWNVRKREDGRYGVVPLIPIDGALHPRWQAADPNVFDSPSEAWDYAIELRKQSAKAIEA